MIAKRVLMSIQLQGHPKGIKKGLSAMGHKHTLEFVCFSLIYESE